MNFRKNFGRSALLGSLVALGLAGCGGSDNDSDEPEAVPADPGPGTPADFTVAYEDDDVIVVDKPAGVVVHPAKGHWSGTLSQALAGRTAGGDAERPGIVHRLDVERLDRG